MLHTAGPEAQEINQTLVYANDDEKKDYNAVLGKLRAYCEPRKNVVFERHRFWSRDQLEHETIGQWTTELRTRAANCEFQESDNMIRDKIVFGVRDRPVQEKLLREYDLTLEKALDICRASETSKEQYHAMSSQHQQDITVHDIRAGEKRGHINKVRWHHNRVTLPLTGIVMISTFTTRGVAVSYFWYAPYQLRAPLDSLGWSPLLHNRCQTLV